VVRLVETGGSLTQKTENVSSLSLGQGTLKNKWVPKTYFTSNFLWLIGLT